MALLLFYSLLEKLKIKCFLLPLDNTVNIFLFVELMWTLSNTVTSSLLEYKLNKLLLYYKDIAIYILADFEYVGIIIVGCSELYSTITSPSLSIKLPSSILSDSWLFIIFRISSYDAETTYSLPISLHTFIQENDISLSTFFVVKLSITWKCPEVYYRIYLSYYTHTSLQILIHFHLQ